MRLEYIVAGIIILVALAACGQQPDSLALADGDGGAAGLSDFRDVASSTGA